MLDEFPEELLLPCQIFYAARLFKCELPAVDVVLQMDIPLQLVIVDDGHEGSDRVDGHDHVEDFVERDQIHQHEDRHHKQTEDNHGFREAQLSVSGEATTFSEGEEE